MADNNIDGASSHPFFVHAEFPFMFIPATSTAGFSFTNNDTPDFISEDLTTNELLNDKEKSEDRETVEDDIDQEETKEDATHEKDDLRISQPEYSELLKNLDFSKSRMVDVTNLLSDDIEGNIISNQNENQKKNLHEEKSQSLLSSTSSESNEESIEPKSSSNIDNTSQTKDDDDFKNSNQNIQNELNNLAYIIQQATEVSNKNQNDEPRPEENSDTDLKKKQYLDEDDDTSKQATQNYDLNDNEKEAIGISIKSNRNPRFNNQNSNDSQDNNLSSIPRLNTSTNNRTETHEQSSEYIMDWDNLVNGKDAFMQPSEPVLIAQMNDEIHKTPNKEQSPISVEDNLSKHKKPFTEERIHNQSNYLSKSSSDSTNEILFNPSQEKESLTSQPQLSMDDDLHDFTNHLEKVLHEQDQRYTTSSDILFRRLSNQQADQTNSNIKKSQDYLPPTSHRFGYEYNNTSSTTNDAWLSMLEKLEQEHKKRLEQQQKQYEDYMRNLEENMKRRFDQYLSATNSFQESESDKLNESKHIHHTHSSVSVDTNNSQRFRTYSNTTQYRPLADQILNQNYPMNSTSYAFKADKSQSNGRNLSRSQSREDISNLRAELSAKHAKHISDLKLYYEHEIEELKNQLNISRKGHTSSNTTRQSMETIERINNENILLHDEMKALRLSLKKNEEENHSFRRQLEELRDQIKNKDLELKNCYGNISELEKKLDDVENIKERQNEKFRHIDRQALFYREENEKLVRDLNLTRERLNRLEERYRELENEHKKCREQTFKNENNHQRLIDDHNFSSTMPLNIPTSREYGRFTLIKSRYSSSAISTSRDEKIFLGTTNDLNNSLHHENSPRSLNKMNDHFNEKSAPNQLYTSLPRPLYSPRKTSPNHHCIDQMPVKDFVDDQIRQSEQLEAKFDDLLKKKRDLESRINRIPLRGLTNTDRQLLEVLEREIERVEQQISSVKLELRKMNILRTY